MKAITDRRSIRKYKNIPLEEEKIKDILRASCRLVRSAI